MSDTPSVNVAAEDIRARLEVGLRARGAEACVVTFDGDGTLWSGDVGEDVFLEAVTERALTEAARPALFECALAHQVSTKGDANDIARSIFEAYRAHAFPERLVCEVMTWCYAGMTLGDLHTLTRQALTRTSLPSRYNQTLLPLLQFVRDHGVRTVVISASPQAIIELAVEPLGFQAEEVVAAVPVVLSGSIQSRMAGPTPYAEHKVEAGRRHFGDAHWLGCFGDNIFDAEMLRAAEVPVAVSPKPALRAALGSVPGIVVLES
ncbi:MAG: HAD family hydrolase [Polyangiaceae bacterium]|nr:HAD family hydrolase [Polyangiaceae bacterium]